MFNSSHLKENNEEAINTHLYTKSINPDLFADKDLVKNYICPLCQGVVKNPLMEMCCGKTFCEECLNNYMKKNDNKCPISGKIIAIGPFPITIIKDTINNLILHCKYNINGCGWNGKYIDYEAHLKICPKKLIKCINECGSIIPREDMKNHLENECSKRFKKCEFCGKNIKYTEQKQHEEICPSKKIACPLNCGAFIKKSDIEFHKNNECPNSVIICEFSELGCKQTFIKKNKSNIINHYAGEHIISLLNCYKDMKKQIENLEKTVKGLENRLKYQDNLNNINYGNCNISNSNSINTDEQKTEEKSEDKKQDQNKKTDLQNNVYNPMCNILNSNKDFNNLSNKTNSNKELNHSPINENHLNINNQIINKNISSPIANNLNSNSIYNINLPEKKKDKFLTQKRNSEDKNNIYYNQTCYSDKNSSISSNSPTLEKSKSTINEKTKETFDIKNLQKDKMKISENVVEVFGLTGNKHFFVFADDSKKITPSSNEKFIIKYKLLSTMQWVSLGICDKKVVESNKMDFCAKNKEFGNGCYIISTNNLVWHPSDKCQRKRFSLPTGINDLKKTNTIIECHFQPTIKEIQFYANGIFLHKLEKVELFEDSYFTPCIVFLHNGKAEMSFDY